MSIVRGEAGYDIRANGADLFTEVNADQVVERTFLYLHRAALSTFPDHIRLHAASGVHGGRAFLLVGDAHSGKTTLALRLLFAGLEMPGDEMGLLRDGIATTFPRRFYARASSQDLLPEFGLLDGMLPFVSNSQEARLVGVDPTTFGRPWHIAPAPVAATTTIPLSLMFRASRPTCRCCVSNRTFLRWTQHSCRKACRPS